MVLFISAAYDVAAQWHHPILMLPFVRTLPLYLNNKHTRGCHSKVATWFNIWVKLFYSALFFTVVEFSINFLKISKHWCHVISLNVIWNFMYSFYYFLKWTYVAARDRSINRFFEQSIFCWKKLNNLLRYLKKTKSRFLKKYFIVTV